MQNNNIPFLTLTTPTVIGVLNIGASSTVTISVYPSANQTFGTATGSIVVNAANAAISVSFNFEIVSTSFGDLLVIVQDEYSFLAPGKPLVNGSIVVLSNQVTGYVYSINPCNGTCYFANVSENNYRLDVSGKKRFEI